MRRIGLEFTARGKVGVYDLDEPGDPGPNQVLLETKYTGLTNGTERHALMCEHGYGGSFPGRRRKGHRHRHARKPQSWRQT